MRVHLTLPRVLAVSALAAAVGLAASSTAVGLGKTKRPPTYTGVISIEGSAPAGTVTNDPALQVWGGGSISIPRARHRLQPGDVGVLAGGVEVPECSGSFSRPTAPAGKICIYPGVEGGTTDPTDDLADVLNVAKNGEGAYEATPYIVGSGRYGARISVLAAGPGRFKFTATWAYTPAG
jgi:hypothetical protein